MPRPPAASLPLLLGGLLALLLAGCRTRGPLAQAYEDDLVRRDVTRTLRAFEAAERTLDPEALLAFLSPDFTMLQDGVRSDYTATAAQMRRTLPTLRSFEPRFEDVQVLVLAPDLALTSMTFRDVLTGLDGAVTRMRGPSTMLWRRGPGGWRIVFADSDHYPDPADDSQAADGGD